MQALAESAAPLGVEREQGAGATGEGDDPLAIVGVGRTALERMFRSAQLPLLRGRVLTHLSNASHLSGLRRRCARFLLFLPTLYLPDRNLMTRG